MTKNEALKLTQKMQKIGFTDTSIIRCDGPNSFKAIGECPKFGVTKIFDTEFMVDIYFHRLNTFSDIDWKKYFSRTN